MGFSKAARSEMVISMTLAELFLMLLFVVWYGFTPLWDDAEINRLREQVANLRTEVADQRKQLTENEATIRDLTRRLHWWRVQFPDRVVNEGKTNPLEAAGPGLPKCDKANNLLVEAAVVQGQVSIRLLQRPASIEQSFGGSYPALNSWLTDPTVIQTFLEGVRRANQRAPCRWDYRLYYETKGDYFDGRQQFERVLYAGGRLIQAPAPQ